MSTEDQPSTVAPTAAGSRAVFLSYAREDTDAARRIADALRGFRVEVWFDQTELRGGDAWDQKIRGQIKECALFVPLISARTESRGEGYFRLEWKLADERTHLMAKGMPFLVPVVVDDTADGEAMAPDSFRAVQWTRLPEGVPTPEFVAHVKRLLEAPRRAVHSAVAGAADPGHAGRPAEIPVARGSPAAGLAKAEAPALHQRHRIPIWAWSAGGGVVLGVIAYVALRPPAAKPTAAAAAPVPAAGSAPLAPPASLSNPAAANGKSIAVLPFANFSSDPANAYFADGLHDEVITALAKIHDLKVISRTSVMAYRDVQNRNLRKIAADLGVASILEGSVQRVGNQVHLNVQLIDARTDDHLWADSYTRELTDVFSAETELAVAVTTALKSTLSPQEKSLIARRPTQNQEAYDLYLRARVLDEALSGTSTRADYEQVLELYHGAAALDPAFLLPHVQAALVNGVMYWFAPLDPTPERRELARREVEAAERLAPDAPETHLARGSFEYTCDLNWSGALAEYEQAQRGLPNSGQLLYRIGLAQRRLGDMRAAVRQFQLAADLDPNDSNTILALVETTSELRRYPDVLKLCDRYPMSSSAGVEVKGFRLDAEFELTRDRAAYLRNLAALPPLPNDPTGLLAVYAQAMRVGDFPAADRALADPRMTAILDPSDTFMAPVSVHRALVAWLRGDAENARRFASDALAGLRPVTWPPRQRYFAAMAIALAEALGGQPGPATRDAQAALAAETALDRYSGSMLLYEYGRVLVIVGRDAEALEVLRKIISNPSLGPNAVLRYDPVWSRLKSDPAFDQILDSAAPL